MQNKVRFCVDGHEFENEESDMLGDGEFAPFMVFDIEKQDYCAGTYETRLAAQKVADALNAGNARP